VIDMTTEQQTRLIYDELEQLHASDAKLRWTAAERIAAKLGEGEKVKKNEAQEAAEKFCEDYMQDRVGFTPEDLASLLTSFGTERAAEAVAEERGRIAGEIRKLPEYTTEFRCCNNGWKQGVAAALKIVEGVGK
jgi:hypothetical protein